MCDKMLIGDMREGQKDSEYDSSVHIIYIDVFC